MAGREEVRDRLLVAGIICDLARNEIENAQDLDSLYACSLSGLPQGPLPPSMSFELYVGKVRVPLDHRTRALLPSGLLELDMFLPFRLSPEDMIYIAVKGAEEWSLGANAEQHAPVLETCEAEIAKRSGRVRLALLGITARGYIARKDYASAARWLAEYVELNPSNAGMKKLADTLRSKENKTSYEGVSD